MNMDCKWVESNLEAIFCDTLGEEEKRAARAHIENCATCRNEVQVLMAIDPVIKKYFQTQLAQAVRSDAPAGRISRFRWAFQAGAVAVVAIVLVTLLRTPGVEHVQSPPSVQTAAIPTVTPEAPPVNKNDAAVQGDRAKPAADAVAEPKVATGTSSLVPSTANASSPAFLVSDPAGYSHSIQDYRGFKVLVGVWAPNQPQSITALERIYKTFGSDPTLRFIGVSPQRARKPANTTFPVFSNQNSQLLGAKPGEFVLLDESGTVTMRGLMAEDFEVLSKTLREK
jgi:hypothetical protein